MEIPAISEYFFLIGRSEKKHTCTRSHGSVLKETIIATSKKSTFQSLITSLQKVKSHQRSTSIAPTAYRPMMGSATIT